MKNVIFVLIFMLGSAILHAQINPTVKKEVKYKGALPYAIKKPTIEMVSIPAGTFTMGSPEGEIHRKSNEIEHQVSLSAFRMSKYEITNAQYATFLNAKEIGSNGKYAAGAYPTQALIYKSSGYLDRGLLYTDNKWVPVTGCENQPVVYVTWYGANEFALYMGGSLPTEAQWEYACRGGTTTAFNTGACLTDAQANYRWADPQTGCSNTDTSSSGDPQVGGTYPPNAYGLYDMHGNVEEWCSDWWGDWYQNTATTQTNPTGPAPEYRRVVRGGNMVSYAMFCRSAFRGWDYPHSNTGQLGFRIVRVP